MWTKSHSIVTKEVTKEQMWKLFADVNNWHTWDEGIEFAKMEGEFEKGNFFTLRPKGGPNVKVELLETVENKSFLDVTKFPLAKMFDNNNFSEFNVCEFMNQKKIVFKTTSSLVNRKHIFSISVNGILVKKVNYSF